MATPYGRWTSPHPRPERAA